MEALKTKMAMQGGKTTHGQSTNKFFSEIH